jgi:hypothetical protein
MGEHGCRGSSVATRDVILRLPSGRPHGSILWECRNPGEWNFSSIFSASVDNTVLGILQFAKSRTSLVSVIALSFV